MLFLPLYRGVEKLVNSLGVALPRDVRSNRAPATNQVKQTQKNMNILELKLKQERFAEIVSGEKRTETREIRPNTAHRYIEYFDPKTGVPYPKDTQFDEGADIDARPLAYDAIRFTSDRSMLLVRIEKAEIFILQDEDGNDVVYEYKGRKYVAAQIDYTLGDIIEQNV